MDDATRKKTIGRLQIAEEHVRAVQRMLDKDDSCIDIIRHIGAIQSALGKVVHEVSAQHLGLCVTRAVHDDDATQREQVLSEIADLFEHKTT